MLRLEIEDQALAESMMTQAIYAIWPHQAKLS